jgi:ribosomal protein S20
LVKQAVSIIDSAVTKGILKRRTASRYVSRLATRTPPSA